MNLLLLLPVALSVLTSGCSTEQARVPIGSWKDTQLSRYMTIESVSETARSSDPQQYKVTLFSSGLSPKRHVTASIKDGVFTLNTAEADIPVFYHPSGDLILINGQSTFRRVTLNDAKIPIRDHHSGLERGAIY